VVPEALTLVLPEAEEDDEGAADETEVWQVTHVTEKEQTRSLHINMFPRVSGKSQTRNPV